MKPTHRAIFDEWLARKNAEKNSEKRGDQKSARNKKTGKKNVVIKKTLKTKPIHKASKSK